MGRQVLTTFEVTEFEPGRRVTIEAIDGSFPIRVTRSVEPVDGGSCRVSAEISGEPGGFFRLAAPLVQKRAQRSVDADYDRLKTLLESA